MRPGSPAHSCSHSLGSQYRSVRQKATGSKHALQQRHEVLRTENPGGGYQGVLYRARDMGEGMK
jgi:hypothetical protein